LLTLWGYNFGKLEVRMPGGDFRLKAQ